MVDSNAAVPSTEDDVRAVAEPHGIRAREIAALTVFVDRVQTDQDSRVMPKWRIHAMERLAQSLDALSSSRFAGRRMRRISGAARASLALRSPQLYPRHASTLIEQDGRR